MSARTAADIELGALRDLARAARAAVNAADDHFPLAEEHDAECICDALAGLREAVLAVERADAMRMVHR